MIPKKRLLIFIGGLVLAAAFLLFSLVRSGFLGSKEGSGFKCGSRISYQGYNYKTVKIGEQCWMKENLKVVKYKDGTPIPNLTDGNKWKIDKSGAYVCYQNDQKNCKTLGALYNWYAVNNKSGLCPAGWSIPSQDQWIGLEKSVCESLGYENCKTNFTYGSTTDWLGTDEGNHLKSVASKGKDTYGFSALLGGFCNFKGSFSLSGEKGYWWTSTPSEEFAYGIIMDINSQGVRQVKTLKSSGFSVRCIKD